MILAILMFLSGKSYALDINNPEVKETISNWFGSSDNDKINYEELDITCDNKNDYIFSKKYDGHHPNGEHIRLVFITDHNNKVESIPSYIFYEEKHSHSNYVCGDINQEYKFITKFMEPSEKEKNIHSRMYCNKAIQILSNGCTSKPMTFGFFTNEKGAHFTMITRDK